MEGKKRVADGGLQGLDIFGGTERERESVKRMVYHFYKTFPEMRQWNVLPRKAAIVIDKMAESAVSDDRFPESFEPYRDRLEDMGYEVRGPDRFIVLSKSSLKDIKRLYLELTEELTHHFFQAGTVFSYHHWTHFCVIFLASNYLSPNSALMHRFLQSDGAAGAIDPEDRTRLNAELHRAESILKRGNRAEILAEMRQYAETFDKEFGIELWGKSGLKS